jgi:hypothetical protein
MNEMNREQWIKGGDKPAKTSALQRDRQSSKPKSYAELKAETSQLHWWRHFEIRCLGVATGDSATTVTVHFLFFSSHVETNMFQVQWGQLEMQHQPTPTRRPVMTIILTTTGKRVRKSTEIVSKTPSTSSKRRRSSERNLIKTSQ